MRNPKMILAQVSPGIWMELPNRIGKRESKKRITRYIENLNNKPITFNPKK